MNDNKQGATSGASAPLNIITFNVDEKNRVEQAKVGGTITVAENPNEYVYEILGENPLEITAYTTTPEIEQDDNDLTI